MGTRAPRFGVRLLDPDDMAGIADEHRRGIIAAARQGQTIGGARLGVYKSGPRKGEPITLRRTGALFEGLDVERTQAGATLKASATYSRHVLGRFDTVLVIDADETKAAIGRRFRDKQTRTP